MSARMTLQLTVNGHPRELNVEVRKTLADALREDLGLTGTHLGCEHGVCGACTVLVNGEAVRSCLMLAVQARDAQVLTIEGVERDGQLHPVQQAFRESHSFSADFAHRVFLSARWGCSRRTRARPRLRFGKRSPATSAAAPATRASSKACVWQPRR